jgi:hypothetical protein
MSQIVEVGEDGSLRLPPELLERVKPRTRFVVQRVSGALILQPEGDAPPFWATATPQERAEDLMRWVESRTEGANLPLEALSRETIYD